MRRRTSMLWVLLALVFGCGERRADVEVAPNVVDRSRLGGELLFVDASRDEVDALDVMKANPAASVARIKVPAAPRLIVERRGGVRRTVGKTTAPVDPMGGVHLEGNGLPPEEVLVLSDGTRDAGGDYVDRPALTRIDTKHKVRRYELSAPVGQLQVSHDGRYVLLWGPSDIEATDSLLRNPNRVALVDLDAEPSDVNPWERTLKAT